MIPKTAIQAGIFGVGKFLSRIISFIAFIYVARYVGPTHMGVYIYLISVASMLLPIATNTIPAEIQIKSKQLKKRASEDALGFFTLSSFMTSVIAIGVVLFKGYSVPLALGTAAIVATRSFYEFFSVVHFVSGRIRYVTLSAIGERILFAVIVFLLPQKTLTLIGAAALSLLIFDFMLLLKSKIKVRLKLDFSYFSWVLFPAILFSAVGTRLPFLIYASKLNLIAFGIFGAAFSIYEASSMIFIEGFKFIQARVPEMTKSGLKKFLLGILGLSFFSLFLVLALWSVGVFVVDLIYGSKYPEVGIVFANLALSLPALILSFYPRGMLLYNSQKKFTLSFFFYAVFSISAAVLAKDLIQAALYLSLANWATTIVLWLLFALDYFSNTNKPFSIIG